MRANFKLIISSAIFLGFALAACQPKTRDDNTLYVGTLVGPETQIMQVAAKVAKKQENLDIKIFEFEDYNTPNTALAEGSIDANVFQHQPYLNLTIHHRGYPIETIGKTFVYPMGLYSSKIKTLDALPAGAKIAIPNDPSNGARALRLLAKAQLITIQNLEKLNDMELSPKKITGNPKNFKIIELDAAQLPRILSDVDAAVINTNYAMPAGLKPNKDALLVEGPDSLYANIIVIRTADKNQDKYKKLVKILHSQPVLDKAKVLFEDQAIKAW